MITYTYKNGKQHKHLIYSGGIRCLCCKPKKIKGFVGNIFTGCMYAQYLKDLYDFMGEK